MNVLLDTHTFLWFIEGNDKLSRNAKVLIENVTNQSFVSIASLWEMAIKVSNGKLILVQPIEVLITQQLSIYNIEVLSISVSHLAIVTKLPFYHRDPFDRLIIAQGIVEGLPIIVLIQYLIITVLKSCGEFLMIYKIAELNKG